MSHLETPEHCPVTKLYEHEDDVGDDDAADDDDYAGETEIFLMCYEDNAARQSEWEKVRTEYPMKVKKTNIENLGKILVIETKISDNGVKISMWRHLVD